MVEFLEHGIKDQRAARHAVFRGRKQEGKVFIFAVIAHNELLDMLRHRAPHLHPRIDIAAITFAIRLIHIGEINPASTKNTGNFSGYCFCLVQTTVFAVMGAYRLDQTPCRRIFPLRVFYGLR